MRRRFREQFVRAPDEQERNANLRGRLHPLCVRTLRKQVIEYIPFTRRVPVTQEFIPGDDEHVLYERVRAYLQRETLIALPASQRQLITLVLRKLLASSTFAIASTLRGLIGRVERMAQGENINLLDEEPLRDQTNLKKNGNRKRPRLKPRSTRNFCGKSLPSFANSQPLPTASKPTRRATPSYQH